MDRNTIIGFALIALILIGYTFLKPQDPKEVTPAKTATSQTAADSIATASASDSAKATIASISQATDSNAKKAIADSAYKQAFGAFAKVAQGKAQIFRVTNGKVTVDFSTKGGAPVAVQLNEYKAYPPKTGGPLYLYRQGDGKFSYVLSAQGRAIRTDQLYFQPVGTINAQQAIFRAEVGPNQYIQHAFALKGDSYELEHAFSTTGLQGILAPNIDYMPFDWGIKAPHNEKDKVDEGKVTTVFYKELDENASSLDEVKPDKEVVEGKIEWVSLKQKFFNATYIAGTPFEKATMESKAETEAGYVKSLDAQIVLPLDPTADNKVAANFYFGPNHYQTLSKLDIGLERLVKLGPVFLRWINTGVIIPIFNWLNSFGLNFGIIILVLTLIIKVATSPLTFTSQLATARMRVLKPEIDEISAKYPNTDQAMQKQQAMSALYRQAGVNPLGGCFPVLLQIPIFIALVSFFPSSIELRQEALFWAEDLSAYDSIAKLPFEIPFYGAHISLFTILFTMANMVFTYYNNQVSATAMTKQMQILMYIMPIFFLGFFNSLPAGLGYYYFVSTLLSILQQIIIRASINESKVRAKIDVVKAKGGKGGKDGKGGSGWISRMENMAKVQQQQARQQATQQQEAETKGNRAMRRGKI